MTDVDVIQPLLVIEVTTSNGPPLQIEVAGAPVINVQEVGLQGPGVPAGGVAGQVLAKVSGVDFATEWADPNAAASIPWTNVTGKPAFAAVATSGAYGDLSGRPTLGTAAAAAVGDFATAAQGVLAGTALQPGAAIPWTNITGKPAFATVATTGAYGDLSGRPTLGTAAASAVGDFAATARGLPAGGTSGQVLAKSSGTDYATGWIDPPAGGGGGATNLSYDAATQTVVSDTGTDAVLPLASTVNPGLAPVLSNDADTYLDGTGNYAQVLRGLCVFGNGSDGNVTISSGTTTLTSDKFYNNLTINGTGVLNTAGFKVYVKGTLDISEAQAGAIHNRGPNGNAGATAGTGGTISSVVGEGTTVSGGSRNAGGAGGTAAGAAAAAAGTGASSMSGGTPSGGKGGVGSGGAGGNGTVGSTPAIPGYQSFNRFLTDFLRYAPTVSMYGTARSASGGGGGGDGTAGGGGGSGGTSAGIIGIWAHQIQRGSNTNAGIIDAKGGNGGAGGSAIAGNRGGGGGGSGGAGGLVYIVYEQLLGTQITNAIDVSGGSGANGGAGFGTGRGGTGGGRGGSGRAVLLNFNTGDSTFLVPDAGAVGGTTVTTTPGVGLASVPWRMNL